MLTFRFRSELWTAQYTGTYAKSLQSFYTALKSVDDSTIYYHLYRNLFEYHHMPTEFPNSFAYWLAQNHFDVLAEKFSAIDITEYTSLEGVRFKMLSILEEGLEERERPCKPFYFMRAVRKVVDTGEEARSVQELAEGINRVGINSLFYHLISSRLVHRRKQNDFSYWLSQTGEKEKSLLIERIDIMTRSLYEVREELITILQS